jgi:hypothetical protein
MSGRRDAMFAFARGRYARRARSPSVEVMADVSGVADATPEEAE